MVRQWTPVPPSDFDDLRESLRCYDLPVLLAVCVWGAALTGAGLVVTILLGRDVPTGAWAVPGALAALGGVIAGVIAARNRNP